MTFPFRGLVGFGLLAGVCLGLAGCSPPPAEAPAQPPPVQVSYPLHEEITEYGEYTGRTAAPNAVEVRSRVSGYLVKIHFTEGAEVNGGEVLYEIDPRPYQAALDQAQANLKQAQANLGVAQTSLKLAQATLDIDLKAGKAITELQLSQDKAAVETNQAQVQAANAAVAVSTAAVQTAKLNLEWTKVTSPISGQIGRTQITQGNLVIADQTLLTTIVSLDPLWAYFDVDEPTVLKVRELIRQGKLQSAMEGAKIPLRLG
ncbi:MAG: efflux RND transporter periplasmic adaptor subunit, partial [Planctomycetes bacterium]|nr:efflux RND transporter periplasmic adaptor subunit [Planctomycetota bacterium]